MGEDLMIGMVEAAGGGRIGLCRLPDLPADLAALTRWEPAVVVTMTPADEMARLGAADLPGFLGAAGIAWRHFPIRDYGVPDAAAADEWPALAAELHARLDAGEGVLLHCRAGLGRSGMIALRLMVERGEAPDAALARLREARPGAVETEAQLQWASAATRT